MHIGRGGVLSVSQPPEKWYDGSVVVKHCQCYDTDTERPVAWH